MHRIFEENDRVGCALPRAGVTVVAGLVGALLMLGCGNQDPEGAMMLWDQFQAADYRNTFERAPGYPTRMPTSAPHSSEVDIYVNSIVGDALAAGSPLSEWPNGSLIVKDGFSTTGDHRITAAMEKQGAEWFWAEYEADGEPFFSGSPGLCRNCHEDGDDFVLAFSLP